MLIFKGEQQGDLKDTMITGVGIRYLVEVKVKEGEEEVTKLQWWNPDDCKYNKPTPKGGELS